MSWTYDGDLSVARDYVRMLIGDTDTNDQQFQDVTITSMLTRVGSSPLAAALALTAGLVAYYSRRVNLSVDGLSVQMGQRAEHYRGVLRDIKMMIATDPSAGSAPIVAGVSIAAMISADQNTDRPPSRDVVGMMEMPGVLPPNAPDSIFSLLY